MESAEIGAVTWAEVELCRHANRSLSYKIPPELLAQVDVGSLVTVPLRGKKNYGVVVKIGQMPLPFPLRPILECVSPQPISSDLLDTVGWLNHYYNNTRAQAFRCIFPTDFFSGKVKEARFYTLASSPESCTKAKQQLILRWLEEAQKNQPEGIEEKEIRSRFNLSAKQLRSLQEKGFIREIRERHLRRAYQEDDLTALAEEKILDSTFQLNPDQLRAANELKSALDEKNFRTFLLSGVTGSGKTEVYFEAIETAIKLGGSVIYLVPEVSLLIQALGRLRARLEKKGWENLLTVWHSRLGSGVRFDSWDRMLRGEARIVLGVRSAIFAPVRNLALIVVDEEHDGAYKQNEIPLYSARDLAVYRASKAEAVCLLGSATPSLESFYNAKIGKYGRLDLPQRVGVSRSPAITYVNLCEQGRYHLLLSRPLSDAIQDRISRQEQVILLLNRRGFARSLYCPTCGHVVHCPNCSIPLVPHHQEQLCKCHFCGYVRDPIFSCPRCRSYRIWQRGSAIQRAEVLLQQRFPDLRLARCDRDLISNDGQLIALLRDFAAHRYDLLLGTQMISKGLDFPHVTLVGVLDGDLDVQRQDFRSGELSLQRLLQIAGRAGRRDRLGEVIIQTRQPKNSPLQAVLNGDVDIFYEKELEIRKIFSYPPFRHLVCQIFSCEDQELLRRQVSKWVQFLRQSTLLQSLAIMKGPVVPAVEKRRNRYYQQLWFLASSPPKLLAQLKVLRENFGPLDEAISENFDVDATNLS